jgi:hypothetical protein
MARSIPTLDKPSDGRAPHFATDLDVEFGDLDPIAVKNSLIRLDSETQRKKLLFNEGDE